MTPHPREELRADVLPPRTDRVKRNVRLIVTQRLCEIAALQPVAPWHAVSEIETERPIEEMKPEKLERAARLEDGLRGHEPRARVREAAADFPVARYKAAAFVERKPF